MSPILEARHLSVQFTAAGRGLFARPVAVKAVDDVSIAVERGRTLAIVGESGSGKTTLGRALAHLQAPTGGEVLLDGRPADAAELRRRIQVVFQDPFSALDPRMTVRRLLEEPLIVHRRGLAETREARVRELMRMVGIDPSYENRYPHEFSGGQRQRIAIARALAIGPEILLADEPLSALDVSIQAQIINLLDDLKTRLKFTMIMISHDLSVVGHVADRVVVMFMGRLVETGTVDEVFSKPAHPYTRALLAAAPLPDPSRRNRPQAEAAEDVPAPKDGCRYRARCAFAQGVCGTVPALADLGPGRQVACHMWKSLPEAPETLAFDPPYRHRLDSYVQRRAAAMAAKDRQPARERDQMRPVQQGDPR